MGWMEARAEEEVNQLIAGSSKKVATFIQLLKETGMRPGEAWSLKWIDFDFTKRRVHITPEKGRNPRILPISNSLIAMIKALERKNEYSFNMTRLNYLRARIFSFIGVIVFHFFTIDPTQQAKH